MEKDDRKNLINNILTKLANLSTAELEVLDRKLKQLCDNGSGDVDT